MVCGITEEHAVSIYPEEGGSMSFQNVDKHSQKDH
jgi:hypothetical protein